jgi:hypothetical protein
MHTFKALVASDKENFNISMLMCVDLRKTLKLKD